MYHKNFDFALINWTNEYISCSSVCSFANSFETIWIIHKYCPRSSCIFCCSLRLQWSFYLKSWYVHSVSHSLSSLLIATFYHYLLYFFQGFLLNLNRSLHLCKLYHLDYLPGVAFVFQNCFFNFIFSLLPSFEFLEYFLSWTVEFLDLSYFWFIFLYFFYMNHPSQKH
jgi:hypothetical protein